MTPRLVLMLALFAPPLVAADPPPWWNAEAEKGLGRAGPNRPELEKFLNGVPEPQRPGAAFLVAHMPDADAKSLKADFLLTNTALTYKARGEFLWAKAVPEEIFLNDVLPYAHLDETREGWRKEFYELCAPIVKDCKTASEAAQKLNAELFPKIKVKYSTGRKKASQSPGETIAQGRASCTGLSIVLADACRAVGVPARLAGTANWWDKRGNHAWVEIWDHGWHFAGACEPDPKGLDRGWFVGDAEKAIKGSEEHGIFATSFRRTGTYFPLVWDRDSKQVPGEDVTERYAKKVVAKPGTVSARVQVLGADRKRVAAPVTASRGGKKEHEGVSKGETADANDFSTFELAAEQDYLFASGAMTVKIRTPKEGTIAVVLAPQHAKDAGKKSDALKQLAAALDAGTPVAELAGKPFALVPLSKADAAEARKLLWQAHAAAIRKDRAAEVKDRVIKDGSLEMPFAFTVFGDKPEKGRSLYISLHGGGGAPKQVNDGQWKNQQKLYTPAEGIYLAPRAPTNTWNLWHEGHIDRMFSRLIEDLIVLESVDPDKVYVMGYSAGGDGVYQLAPRMADRWAAAAMMAGHPNEASPLSLRNVPFALQVGGNDAVYKRNTVAKEYGEQLDALEKADAGGYKHFVKIYEGKGHWMDREDKVAVPWMAKFERDPVPARVVWKQAKTPHDRSYWLAVPPGTAKGDTLVIAERSRRDQTIDVVRAEGVSELIIRFDARTADLDKPVRVTHAGKELFSGVVPRTVAVMANTLAGRGDPRLVFDAEVRVQISSEEKK